MKNKSKIAIIGAGISGLSNAYWLDKAGFDVSVFEKDDRAGGSIITEHEDGFLIDLGPNSTLETSQELTDLVSDLGLNDQKVYGNENSNNRYIVRNGQLHALPMNPIAFLKTPLFSWRAKLRLFKEPFIKPTNSADISLSDFVKHRLGKEFLDYAINPFVAGVYAGDPENLSTKSAFPKLFALEQNYGSLIKGAIKGKKERKQKKEIAKNRARLFSFKDGMSVLPNTITKKISQKIFFNTTLLDIKYNGQFELLLQENDKKRKQTFDKIILSIPTFILAKVLNSLINNELLQFEKVNYPPVSVVFTGFNKHAIKRNLDGFGFLVPKLENRKILGSIWSSQIFPNRAPENCAAFTTFVGGTRQPDLALVSDAELEKMVQNDLNDLVGISEKPVIFKIKRWHKAIPQYELGYQNLQNLYSEIEQKFPGLHFSGNFVRGISVADSVLCAHETVQKIINANSTS